MHDEFDVKVDFYVYFSTDGFDLTKMPVKYKTEWQENSDWMKLNFHALHHEPPKMPYLNATYHEMKNDFLLVADEICRFAGHDSLSTITAIHWGDATRDGCRALRDCGVRGLVSKFGGKTDENV